jgi:uncharacterized protein DUF1207
MPTRASIVASAFAIGFAIVARTTPPAVAAEEAQAERAAAEEPPVDCRYASPPEREPHAPLIGVFLPKDGVFRPLLADPKEPRFSASYQSMRFEARGIPGERSGDTVDVATIGAGIDFGLAGFRQQRECNGAQLGLFGAIFSQFNMDSPSSDLINSDFVVGVPLSFRWGPISGRGRLYHQSSHLGDEFLLDNPDVDRVNLSFEAIDAVVSLDLEPLRIYGGGGYLIRTEPDLARGIAQWGGELRLERLALELSPRARALPIAGADFHAFQEQDWDVTTSVVGGLEFGNVIAGRRLRLAFVYLNGFLPYSQYFNTAKVESYGIMAQFEL